LQNLYAAKYHYPKSISLDLASIQTVQFADTLDESQRKKFQQEDNNFDIFSLFVKNSENRIKST